MSINALQFRNGPAVRQHPRPGTRNAKEIGCGKRISKSASAAAPGTRPPRNISIAMGRGFTPGVGLAGLQKRCSRLFWLACLRRTVIRFALVARRPTLPQRSFSTLIRSASTALCPAAKPANEQDHVNTSARTPKPVESPSASGRERTGSAYCSRSERDTCASESKGLNTSVGAALRTPSISNKSGKSGGSEIPARRMLSLVIVGQGWQKLKGRIPLRRFAKCSATRAAFAPIARCRCSRTITRWTIWFRSAKAGEMIGRTSPSSVAFATAPSRSRPPKNLCPGVWLTTEP